MTAATSSTALRQQTRLLQRIRIADGVIEDLVDLDKSRYPTFPSWVWTGISTDDAPLVHLRSPGGVQLYALDLENK